MNDLAELPADGRPLFILARTNPTQGVPLMREKAPNLHYMRFSSDEERGRYQAAYEQMIAEG
jgi:transketolase